MKTCFSEGKLMKQFGNPPLSKRTPPISTNPSVSEQFFHDPPLCPNFKNKNPPPPPLILGGRGNYVKSNDKIHLAFFRTTIHIREYNFSIIIISASSRNVFQQTDICKHFPSCQKLKPK